MIRLTLLFPPLLALAACEAAPSEPVASPETHASEVMPSLVADDPSKAKEAVKELESWDAIIEVLHDETRVVQWEVGVKNDGTMRYGLAESICMELRDRGVEHARTWVRIIDRPALMVNGGDFQAASLGRVRCSDGTSMNP